MRCCDSTDATEWYKPMSLNYSIDPSELAFDIDGVVADTMEVFARLARERYGLTYFTKEHICYYDLYRCLDVDPSIVDDLICLTLDDEHTREIEPMPGAIEVLTELAGHGPLRFVTARVWPESIVLWLHEALPDVPKDQVQVIASGAPEAKLEILRRLKVRHFVEDRLETCRLLAQDGVRPLLFDQPWNRVAEASQFTRIENWSQLAQMILPQNSK
jgi:uncharacterized HAD superfamily protein